MALGPDHPNVAFVLNDLALLRIAQGRYSEAEPLYLRALAIREKALGPEHPNVATSLNNLAELYGKQGRYDKQQRALIKALNLSETSLGSYHPDLIPLLVKYAFSLRMNGRHLEARKYEDQAGVVRAKNFGPAEKADTEWIRGIVFEGNSAVTDTELLSVLTSRSASRGKFGYYSDYNVDRLSYDREILRSYYLTDGYADVEVQLAPLEPGRDKEGVDVKFIIIEGPQYNFGDIELTIHFWGLSRQSMLDSIQSIQGDLYNTQKISRTIDALRDRAADLGYPSIEVSLQANKDPKNQMIGIIYEIR